MNVYFSITYEIKLIKSGIWIGKEGEGFLCDILN